MATASIAGTSVPFRFRFADTERYLRRFMQNTEDVDFSDAVSVTEQEFADWASFGNPIDAFAEFCLLCEQTSEYLLPRQRCVFHAAALSFRGHAWLIAAGSGVGKSTLCRSLMESFPDEITVINGDKPALQFAEGQGILVHPSPWNGKEGWRGAVTAPLAGLVLLRRGAENAISPMKPEHAAPRIYGSVFQSWADGAALRRAADMTERIADSAPIWQLTSREAKDSCRLLYVIMCQEAERHGL